MTTTPVLPFTAPRQEARPIAAGERIAWHRPGLGLVIGSVYPRGLTAYRDGVARTKPHFLSSRDVRRIR